MRVAEVQRTHWLTKNLSKEVLKVQSKVVRLEGEKTFLVTGATGFIGSHLTRELVKQGQKVLAFDISPDTTYIRDVLDKVTFVQGDVSELSEILDAIRGYDIDCIFHLAAMLVPDSDKRPATAIKVNCGGFNNVLEAARILRIRRVVWASSLAVCGLSDFYDSELVSEDLFVKPTTLYGACKLFQEHIASYYREMHGIDNIGFRKSIVYGSGKSRIRDLSISHRLIENPILGKPVRMPPGDYESNYVYVKDVVRAYLLACRVEKPEHIVFNIGGHVYKNSEVVGLIKKFFPDAVVEREKQYGLPQPIWVYAQDLARAKEELGYEPAYRLEEGIRDFIDTLSDLGGMYLTDEGDSIS